MNNKLGLMEALGSISIILVGQKSMQKMKTLFFESSFVYSIILYSPIQINSENSQFGIVISNTSKL